MKDFAASVREEEAKERGRNALTIPLSDLIQDDRNANRGTERGSAMLETSLRNYGAGRSLLIDKNGRIIAGNKTAEQAGSIGLEDVIVVQTDGKKLVAVQRMDLDLRTDKAAKELAIADNRVGQVSLDWDPEVVKALSGEVDLSGMFSDKELALLLADTAGAALLTDADDVPEPPAVPVTQPGDLYVMGDHRLLCGDSTKAEDVERLMDGAKADLVFTDPPYGVSFQSGMSKRFDVLRNDDKILDVAPVVWAFMGENTAAFVWTSHQAYPVWRAQFADFYKQTIVWHKPGGGIGDLSGSYANDYEMALFCVKGRPLFRGKRGMAVWTEAKDAAVTYAHPTQKPVALCERAAGDFTDAGAVVLDLFGGSGSTLIACEKTGRKARLMELDPIYCDVIVNRWEIATGKKAVRYGSTENEASEHAEKHRSEAEAQESGADAGDGSPEVAARAKRKPRRAAKE